MRVDLYSACWNNAELLGWFFRHYDEFVTKYYFYYDDSSDGTSDILKSHPRVESRDFKSAVRGAGRIAGSMELVETCWRESSAEADWVIIAEIDEHLYHSNMLAYLARCQRAGVTFIPALGYQMVSDKFPSGGERLYEQVVTGAPWQQMSKLSVFAPGAIERLNYSPGRHTAAPVGKIVAPEREEILLLHYKYLDFERVYQRHVESRGRLAQADIDRGWGHKYFWSREQLLADWQMFEARAVDVTSKTLEPWRTHVEPRWWAALPRVAVAPAGPAGFNDAGGPATGHLSSVPHTAG